LPSMETKARDEEGACPATASGSAYSSGLHTAQTRTARRGYRCRLARPDFRSQATRGLGSDSVCGSAATLGGVAAGILGSSRQKAPGRKRRERPELHGGVAVGILGSPRQKAPGRKRRERPELHGDAAQSHRHSSRLAAEKRVVRLRFVRGNTCCDKYCAKVRASRDFDYGGVKTPPFRCGTFFSTLLKAAPTHASTRRESKSIVESTQSATGRRDRR
jgi:hypothetical protein